ncbi:glycosyltransferase family 2 protein [Klebsiella aerogenes]|uniref:glycosyltransferase family 2 protein n=1 Tax=Klebsiella aerogenes TaxID=548 RepID=UPI0006668849|nr:glycosyltransferase [Klebsiella aerogenes]
MNNNIALQSSVFPDIHHREISSLYFLSDNVSTCYSDAGYVRVSRNHDICFDTFYNSFDLHKWSKYTTVKQIGFKVDVVGRGIATIFLKTKDILKKVFQREIEGAFTLDNLELNECRDGRLYFYWSSIDDSEIRSFSFTTYGAVEDFGKLAIVITTYNRQAALLSTMSRFEENLFSDIVGQSKFHVYVIDNGCNLDLEPRPNVTYIKNKNMGGAGGFTRGLFEVKKNNKETYCIFMDDDASCEIESINRAYWFMCFSKKDEQMIAGSMLYEDKPQTVYEAGAIYPYKQIRMRPLKNGVDVSTPSGLDVFNKEDGQANYAAWWFCAFKVSAIKYYAFPFFVRGDDILFGIMHAYPIVTLNGIASWQMNFNQKYSALVEYLSVRGLLVPAFVYPSSQKRRQIAFWILAKVLLLCFSYRYSSAEAIIEAYSDVMQGPDFWIDDADAQKARRRISELSKDELPCEVEQGNDVKKTDRDSPESKWAKIIRLFLLNGHLVPGFITAGNRVRIPNTEIHPTKQVFLNAEVYYETTEGSFIVLKQDKLRCAKLIIKTLWAISKGFFTYNAVAEVYGKKISYLTSENFWKKYFI